MTNNRAPIPICDYEGSDYQERFWEEVDRAYEDQAEALAIKRLLPERGERLLEVGAGAGRNTPRYRGYRQIVLLDHSRSQLEKARSRLGSEASHLFVAADVYHLPFAPNAFDAATMIRTLHHMLEPDAALAAVRETLAPEALFVLEFANKRNLKAILRWLVRQQDWNPFMLGPVEFAAMNFNFHPRAARRWLMMADFAIGRQLAVSYFRLPAIKKVLPHPLVMVAEGLVQWSGAVVQLSPSVFVQARALGRRRRPLAENLWRCPACRSLAMRERSRAVVCGGCGRSWRLQDGIYDFRLERE